VTAAKRLVIGAYGGRMVHRRSPGGKDGATGRD